MVDGCISMMYPCEWWKQHWCLWHENMSKVEALMVKCVLDVKYESVLMLVWQYFDYNLLLSTIKQLMQPLSGYGLI